MLLWDYSLGHASCDLSSKALRSLQSCVSPVLLVSLRQLLPQVLEAEAVAARVESEAARADDGIRRRTGLQQVVSLAHGAKDLDVLAKRYAAAHTEHHTNR